jgi:GTPase
MTDHEAANQPEKHLPHSGYVVVVGKPNVGKSTLMNQILGEKIAIVSPKPQTTRLRQMGIYTTEDTQAIFVDTPGIHKPHHQLGEFMVSVAREALSDGDVVLFVADISHPPDEEDQRVTALIRQVHEKNPRPTVMALNKLDKTEASAVLPHVEAFQALLPMAQWTAISAQKGDGVPALLGQLVAALPAGVQFYPDDVLSDATLRDLAGEVVREKVLLKLDQEVPHSVAVSVEEFKERSAEMTYIRVTIYVERESQKRILIGKDGGMLKQISTLARQDLEKLIGTRVYLEPWVKVLKEWRSDPGMLRRLGYKINR